VPGPGFGEFIPSSSSSSSGSGSGSSGGQGGDSESMGKVWGAAAQKVADEALLISGLRVDMQQGRELVLGEGEEHDEGGGLAASLASSFCADVGGGNFMSSACVCVFVCVYEQMCAFIL